MEDVSVEGGDGFGIVAEAVWWERVRISVVEVGEMVVFEILIKACLPLFTAHRVGHLVMDLQGDSTEERRIGLLLWRVRLGVRVVDDVSVRSSVACAHDDFAPCVELALHGGDRVRKGNLCHRLLD